MNRKLKQGTEKAPQSREIKPKVSVVGSTNWDMSIKLPFLPSPKETVHGGSCRFSLGGKGANQAVAAARAGAEVFFLTCIGTDSVAREVFTALEDNAIAPAGIVTIPGAETGKAMIFVDRQGENFIGVADGANACLEPVHMERFRAELAAADILLLQLEIPMDTVAAAARIAKQNGVPVILNPAPACSLDEELLSLCDIITPNEVEIERICAARLNDDRSLRKAAARLLDKGPQALLITLGKRGVLIVTATECRQIPAYPVNTVDTTAAGDVFNGTLAVALAAGQPLRDAVEFASAAAALSVTVEGTMPSIPYRQQIDSFRGHQGA